MSRKTVFGIFHCNTPEDLSTEFTDFRIKQQLKAGGNPVPGTLAAAEGLEIKTIEYGDLEVAATEIRKRAEPGGQALAIRVSVGPGIDPKTGELKKIWLVGANVPKVYS